MKIVIHDDVSVFFESLSPVESAKFLHTVELLERFGNELGLPHSRFLGDGLLELRVRGKREIRVLYCFHNKSAVLLHAFIKKTQKTPLRDLNQAKLKKNAL